MYVYYLLCVLYCAGRNSEEANIPMNPAMRVATPTSGRGEFVTVELTHCTAGIELKRVSKAVAR